MKEAIKKFNKKLCAASAFIAVIAYVLIGYYTGCWTWTLFIFLIIPILPIITGIEKVSFELIIVTVYLILGFGFHLWHPYWVLFLLIPIYHTFFDGLKKNKKEKKINIGDHINVDIDDDDDNVEIKTYKDENGKTIITINKK